MKFLAPAFAKAADCKMMGGMDEWLTSDAWAVAARAQGRDPNTEFVTTFMKLCALRDLNDDPSRYPRRVKKPHSDR